MIASAVYRAALTEDAGQAGHVVDSLTAEFEIHVFNSAARLRIPLRRDEVSLEPGQAKLDNRSVQPEWEPDGIALLLDIAEPGEYRLELTVRPTVPGGGVQRASTWRFPAFPSRSSSAACRRAARRSSFLWPWAKSAGIRSSLAGPPIWVLATALPRGRREDAPAVAVAAVSVEQLLWLKIGPGCVLLDVAHESESRRRATSPLAGQGPSNIGDWALELLPSSDPAAPAVQSRGGDSVQTYEIQWPQPLASTATFDLHFLVSGDIACGHVPCAADRRPRRQTRAAIAGGFGRSRLGVSNAGARLADSGAVTDFVSHWGERHSPAVGNSP